MVDEVSKVGAAGADYQVSKPQPQSSQGNQAALFNANYDADEMGDDFSSGPYKNFPARHRDAAAVREQSARDAVQTALDDMENNKGIDLNTLPDNIKQKLDNFPKPEDYDLGKENNYVQWMQDVAKWQESTLNALNNFGNRTLLQAVDENADYVVESVGEQVSGAVLTLENDLADLTSTVLKGIYDSADDLKTDIAALSKKLGVSTERILKLVRSSVQSLHDHMSRAEFLNMIEHEITREELNVSIRDAQDAIENRISFEHDQTRDYIQQNGEQVRETINNTRQDSVPSVPVADDPSDSIPDEETIERGSFIGRINEEDDEPRVIDIGPNGMAG